MHAYYVELDGLGITEQIYESAHSLIFKTRQKTDAPPTLLKVLKTDAPSQKEIVRFHQEYSIAHRIDSPFVAKVLGLINQDHVVALRVEDIGARSLSAWLETDPPSLLDGLKIAISVCRGLQAIHKVRVSHKDISSSNVVWNRETGQVKIIDFGIASILDADVVTPESPQELDGTLAYMSPEQTGRMNRPVDFRTDFYSFGVTLYELFTGKKPFSSPDPLELIHCLIAKSPPAPSSVNPDVPPMLGRILLKLLEKNAENRYQSAIGIEQDLNEVLRQYRDTGTVAEFPLARHDRSDRFLIPSRLYGRDADVAKLINSFERVCDGQMVLSLVSGYSGVGKSSLVQELYRPLAAARGRYITGKYDQYQRDVPYSAIAYAFNGFCDQLLAESADSVRLWKERILGAVGNNGQILIDIMPGIENIVGPQPTVPSVDPQAARNRFNQVLLSFISEICSSDEPLVLFLDDLQWIDQASLELLKLMLLRTRIVGLHMVGAYRDNEVEVSHPLTLMLNAMNSAGQSYDVVRLGNLTAKNVSDLVSDTLALRRSEITDLVEIICRKTQGNAFFATEFFKNLHARKFLTYSNDRWRWEIQQIEDENITENVVEFMASKLRDFGDSTQHALKFAACIGNEFDLRTLSIILNVDANLADILNDIQPAIHIGVIRARNDEYKKVGIIDVSGESISFKFQHDRVQQAAYSLIPAADRPRIHFQIGRLLNENAQSSGNLEDRLFEIVSHLNQALPVVTDADERLSIAELNYQAGVKARSAAAYQASTEYFRQSQRLLPDDAFSTHYAMALKVHLDLARSLYINGAFAESENIYPVLLSHVNSPMDEVRVRMIQMEDYHLQGDYENAIDVQKKGLSLLGEVFPKDEVELEAAIVEELRLTPQHLGERTIEDLLATPELNSEETLAKLRILVGMWMSAYLVSKDSIVQWCSIKMTNLTLKHGNSEFAAYAYGQYGYVCLLRLGKPEDGWRYGDLAVRLADRYDNVEMRGRVYFNFALCVNHWTRHLSTSTDLFRKAYMFSVEGGDWTYAVYGAANIISNLLIEGKPCAEVASLGQRYFEFLAVRADVGFKSFFLPGGYVALLNLLGHTDRSDTFDCEHLNEAGLLSTLGRLPIVEAWFYSAKLRSLFLYRHLDKALAVCDKADIVNEGVPSQIKVPEAYFYSCLIIAATYSRVSDADKQRRLMERFGRYSEDMRIWSDHCPDNFLHKHLLIRAEESRVKQHDVRETLSLYDAAIASAREYGYVNNVALASELKARFWLELNEKSYALIHLQEACQHYRNWGVEGKLAQLQEEFPQLTHQERVPSSGTATHTGLMNTYQLDLESIYKSAQAISGKVAWNDLIESMLSIVMENVGANRGLFLVNEEPDWIVEASASVDQVTGRTVVSSGLRHVLGVEMHCPASVVNYVMNRKRPLIVDSKDLPEPCRADRYFQHAGDLSIICAPIMSHDQLEAILYLENNLSSGVFNQDRARILDVLVTQISISLENARLYENLERRVEERTEELAEKALQLEAQRKTAVTLAEELKRADKAKSEFLANMSHEIRTPMNAVMGLTELVLQSTLTDIQRDYLGTVMDSAESLLSIINDILDFSKIEAGKLKFEQVEFQLPDIVGDTVRAQALRADRKDLELACFVDPAIPIVLLGDPGRLRQVLTNLISNAIKFTEAGEVVVRVEAGANEDGRIMLTFTVRDTGIGIARDKVKAIFEPFEQADMSTTRQYGGTGLGLAICDKLVSLMGGRIDVDSDPGCGSTFRFTAGFIVSDKAEQPALVATAIKDMRVLVVDDNATNRAILKQVLLAKEMAPVTAPSALDGFSLMQEAVREGRPFRLLISDVQMPEIDGYGLAEMIRADASLSDLDIIQLTSTGQQSEQVRCKELRIAAQLTKPVKQSELYNVMLRVLGLDRPDEGGWLAIKEPQAAALPPLRILLAEDSLVNQKVALAVLSRLGHTTVVANHGKEALSILASQEFDVVLMDVQMPEMDGFEATAAIRAAEQSTGKHQPIVAMTAHAMAGDRERCLEAGMDTYVAKPFQRESLLQAIAMAIGSQRSTSEESPPSETLSKVVDWSVALKHVMDDQQLLKDVAQVAIEDTSKRLLLLRAAIEAGNARETRLLAHTVKSTMGVFHAVSAMQCAQELEDQAATDDLSPAPKLFERFKAEVDRVTPILRCFVDSGEM